MVTTAQGGKRMTNDWDWIHVNVEKQDAKIAALSHQIQAVRWEMQELRTLIKELQDWKKSHIEVTQ